MTPVEIEGRLKSMDRRAIALVVARLAHRLLPLINLVQTDYGPEVDEWVLAMNEVLRAVENYGLGQRVSRYQLNVAADIARGTANTLANKARQFGVNAHLHDAELALAAIAFAADAARAETPERVVIAALQVLRMHAQKSSVMEEDFTCPPKTGSVASEHLTWRLVTSAQVQA